MDWVETEEIKTIGEPFIIYYSPRHSVNHGDAVFDVGIANYDIIGSPTEVLVKKYSQCRQRRRIYY